MLFTTDMTSLSRQSLLTSELQLSTPTQLNGTWSCIKLNWVKAVHNSTDPVCAQAMVSAAWGVKLSVNSPPPPPF